MDPKKDFRYTRENSSDNKIKVLEFVRYKVGEGV